ncbi:hypothetical protein IAU60_003245 [Kwoniella sp. DSM 27419]
MIPFSSIPSFGVVWVLLRLFIRTLVVLFIILITLRVLIFPYLIRTRTRFRASAFSLLGHFNALEWRCCDSAGSVIPTFRAERGSWRWGGKKGEVTGLLVYRIEGVTFRLSKGMLQGSRRDSSSSTPARSILSARMGRILTQIIQLLIHHYSSIARIFSLQLVDCRVILEDYDGLEISLGEFALGGKINFEGEADTTGTPSTPVPSPTPDSTSFMRENPLCASPAPRGRSYFPGTFSPEMSPLRSPNLSPPMTPTAFSPMSLSDPAFPPVPPTPLRRSEGSTSRYSDAKRRASVIQSRMTTTAGQIWTRATGRMHGSISIEAYVDDIKVLRQQAKPRAKPSTSEDQKGVGRKEPVQEDQPVQHRPSYKSLRTITGWDERPRLPSGRSIHNLIRPSKPVLFASEHGYDVLISLSGRTKAAIGLGFGPKKGLAGEDTLNTRVELGNLQTTVAALEQIGDVYRTHKVATSGESQANAKRPPQDRFSTRAWPRIILRALASAEIKLRHLSLSHHLSAPITNDSRHSSGTDLSDLSSQTEDKFALTVELADVALTLSAADSSNNQRARNAFGTNSKPECIVRGVGFELVWQSIQLHCIAPGERHDEKSELLAVRQAEITGFSSWRPAGWSREELLFSNDPNLSLVIAQGNVASVDCAFDLQLLHELQAAFRASHPSLLKEETSTKAEPDTNRILPPRIRMVLDIGPMMAVIADRLSENTTTISIASDGLHLGCFSEYVDLIGRRRDRASSRLAFAEEEKLQATRAATANVDYTLPEEMLPAKVRRKFGQTPASIPDDLSIALRGNASMDIEPVSVRIALAGDNVFDLAELGRIHGTFTGDVLGWRETCTFGLVKTEYAKLDWSSMSAALDIGIQEGIHIDLWEKQVVDALVLMGEAHKGTPKPIDKDQKKGMRKLLNRLPSGLSARFSLGQINVFIGQNDINPEIDTKLIRGVWLRTSAVFEYALYKNRAQAFPWRHYLTAPIRAKLGLPEDITTQALAFATRYRPDGGTAALVSFVAEETTIQPVFHGERFMRDKGTRQKINNQPVPHAKSGDDFVGWGFQRVRATQDIAGGKFANNAPPLELSDTAQAHRPWMRVRHARVHLTVQQSYAEAETELKITSRLTNVSYVSDLSHVYSNLHALLAVKRLADAWKRPKPTVNEKSRLHVSVNVLIPNFTGHFAFPLKEQLYFYASAVNIIKPPSKGFSFNADQALLYVPSPRLIGDWEEIGRIKKLSATCSDPGQPLDISTAVDAIRVRVPHMYQMNSLILNINVTIKALKLLIRNFFKGHPFARSLRPVAEAPKAIPKVTFAINYMSLEAKDDPVETSLNLIWRAGLVEQVKRNALEDTLAKKLMLLSDPNISSEESLPDTNGHTPKLTKNATVAPERARWALDSILSDSWIRRMRAAKQEQRRREGNTLRPMQGCGPNIKLPISISPSSQTAPLFRATFQGVNLSIFNPGMSREAILDYMGEVSSPFNKDVEFSLMVPLKIDWTMSEARCGLRDYPLPLIRVQKTESEDTPSFQMSTTLIFAEELSDDDSVVFVPTEIMPAACGDAKAPAFSVDIAKTIMPVKMYGEPRFTIHSKKTTEFTWGNSYQPAISDFTRVIETLSHPPRDPSPKVAFWDKLRLIAHVKPIVEFAGPCHLHMKGTYDPYNVSGLGAGFALAWRGNTKLLINQPNPERETIQIVADELLVAIPDLTALDDTAASGSTLRHEDIHDPAEHNDESEASLIQRRYTKPCARFVNGTRVGFGFILERTCRPWSCKRDCGETENLLHRQCHEFSFKRHQDVKLRSADAIKRDSEQSGLPADSYEGFRSDYVHFSVSVVSPTRELPRRRPEEETLDQVNTLHGSPKATHHFVSWWKTFDHKMSQVIRQGKLFPDSPPKSKKFSKALGTLKYRLDLKPLYVSHIYPQVSKDLWTKGKSESLGVKARIGQLRFDAHQRVQERLNSHPKVKVEKPTNTHKPFYAADLLADDLRVKGIRAHFAERVRLEEDDDAIDPLPRASELPSELKVWFNYLDYIDADRRPFDQDPKIELVDFGDCPHVFACRRVNARTSTPDDDELYKSGAARDWPVGTESSKFGHEKSHHCYLGAAAGVRDVQKRITQERIDELEARLNSYPQDDHPENRMDIKVTQSRIKTLQAHLLDLEKDDRHLSANTLDPSNKPSAIKADLPSEKEFEHTVHIHCPRLYHNNASRDIIFKYIWSMVDRKKEEYFVSHASLRSLRDSIQERIARRRPTPGGKGEPHNADVVAQNMVQELVKSLTEKSTSDLFRLVTPDTAKDICHTPSLGLPKRCAVKARVQLLVFKPQIALRSDATEDAIVLLSLKEVAIQRFQVNDTKAVDDVTADVMSRNYAHLKDVQAFYPTTEALIRESSGRGSRALDFIPLEIFLDERSQATDYDRILLKSEVCASHDAFNHIRLPQGLEWPENEVDEYGEPITHLKQHQDLTTIVTPQLALSATSKHFEALFTVVTDLLIYVDPEYKYRSEAIDDFIRQFDTADRDLGRLIIDVHTIQQTMRNMLVLQQGYETNFERLEEAGKDELFKIRADLQEGYEHLSMISSLISHSLAKDDQRAAMKNASRVNVRVRGMAWHMQEATLEKFAKVEIESVLYCLTSHKNGTADNAVVLGNVLATNPRQDALYHEIVSRDDYVSGVGVKKRTRKPFLQLYWSKSPAIGGIPIYPLVDIELVNVRFRLEERVGLKVIDYIFSDRIRRRHDKIESNAKGMGNGNQVVIATSGGTITPNGTGSLTPASALSRNGYMTNGMGSSDDLLAAKANGRSEIHPLSRSKSQVSILSHNEATPRNIRTNEDTIEMRHRAAQNKMFGQVRLHGLGLNLSYKSDERRKHATFSMPDCVDFKFKTPNMAYNDRVWPMEDIFEHVKRDIKAAAWAQSGDLLSQLFKKTSLFKPKKQLKHTSNAASDLIHAHSHVPPSPLSKQTTHGSLTSSSENAEMVSRVLSRDMKEGNISTSPSAVYKTLSRGNAESSSSSASVHSHGHGHGLGHALSAVFSGNGHANGDEESEDDEKPGGRLKGFIGKFKGRHKHDSPGRSGSSDEHLIPSKS